MTIMNIDENILSKLTDEQKKKVAAAKTHEELLALTKEFGYELSLEQMEAVSGGTCPVDCDGLDEGNVYCIMNFHNLRSIE